MKELIIEIKKKKELAGLSDEFVEQILKEYLAKNRITSTPKGKASKIVIKEVRAILRRYTGQFQISSKSSKTKSLKEKNFDEILQSHSSTKERTEFYPELKKRIGSLHPKSILDLGCGINPLALASKNVTYYACDIKQDELDLISKFFKLRNIKGKTFYCDLRNCPELPKVDLCIIFKVLDLLDTKGHKTTDILLSKINAKYLLVSFSTKKLSGRKMNHPRRFWFENMLKSKNYYYTTFESENEFFYLIGLNQ